MKLISLLERLEYTCIQGSTDQEVKNVVYDSRKVEDGQGACVAQAMGSARAASVVAARRGRRPAACGGLAQDACCKLCSLGGRGKASALRRRGGGHALACLSRSA